MVRKVRRTRNSVTVTDYDYGPNHISFSQTTAAVLGGGSSRSSSRRTASLPFDYSIFETHERHMQSLMDSMDRMAGMFSLFDRLTLDGPEKHEGRRSKETPRERAERLFAKEQRAQRRLNERISRANGWQDYAPPDPFGTSSAGRSSTRTRAGSVDEMPSTTGYEQRIPHRHAHRAAPPSSSHTARVPDPFAAFDDTFNSFPFADMRGFTFRPFMFSEFSGSRAPPMAGRSDEDYRRHVRDEFEAARHAYERDRRSHPHPREAHPDYTSEHRYYENLGGVHGDPFWAPRDRGAARARSDDGTHSGWSHRYYDDAAERAAEAERRERARKLEKERAAKRAQQRQSWVKRSTALFATGEVESVQLTFQDIPWPIYAAKGGEVEYIITLDDLSAKNVKEFLLDLAKDRTEMEYEAARKKVLRDAIRMFHPDRWHRVLPRVEEAERENVKQGVELCSRIINDLLSQ